MTTAPAPVRHHGRPTTRHTATVLFLFAALALAVVLLARHDVFQGSSSGGVNGSGVAATDTRTVPPFQSVELAGGNVVTVRVGGTQSVVVHGDDNLLRYVTTKVESRNLVIASSRFFSTDAPMRVEVTAPSLDAATLSGSGVVTLDGVTGSQLTLSLPGSGVVRATGEVQRLDVTLGGSGDAQLQGLSARDVHAVVSGSGRIVVTATGSLDASVPGSGAIVYHGDPGQVTTSVTGSGAVTRG